MTTVSKSVVVPYAQDLIYNLVNDIEKYPDFIDWCIDGEEIKRDETSVVAALTFEFHGVSYTFTTKNKLSPSQRIDIALVDGPFKQLDGHWLFTPLSDEWSKITLELDFEFSLFGLSLLFEPVFMSMANHWVEAFCQRAKSLANED